MSPIRKRGTRALRSSESDSGAGQGHGGGGEELSVALAALETAVLDACAGEAEWPAQIAAGIYAGVDYAIANPAVALGLTLDVAATPDCMRRYERMVGRLAGFIQVRAPVGTRLPPSTDEALVAGIVGLVGDHIRVGRIDRLEELRPELVLLTLLPYLGFAEAKRWADQVERSAAGG